MRHPVEQLCNFRRLLSLSYQALINFWNVELAFVLRISLHQSYFLKLPRIIQIGLHMIDRIGLELVLARGKGSKSQSKVRRLTLCQNPINIGIKTLWHVLTRIKLYFLTPVQVPVQCTSHLLPYTRHYNPLLIINRRF
jgi:hypothetical protein